MKRRAVVTFTSPAPSFFFFLLLRFTPEERDCYSEEEISLKYLPRDHGYRYEMSNCLFESAFENILEKCKCFPGRRNLRRNHIKAPKIGAG